MNADALIWWLIGAVGMADSLLLVTQRMTVTGKSTALLAVVFLCAVSILYRHRAASIARLALVGAQVAAFSQVGAILTYTAMAASPFPIADALLSRADAAIGFDWLAWSDFVRAHPVFRSALVLAYASIPVQGIALIGYFSFKDAGRVHELLIAAILSIILITPIMVLLPAIGAWTQHGVGLIEPWRNDILALRSHAMVKIGETQGIISFPSFHTILGVLFINMARGCKCFVPVLILNLLLIVSVLTEGAHYGVDVLSGFAATFVVLAAAQFLLARCSPRIRVGTDVRHAHAV